jgi:hypothetical protein
MFKYCNLLLIVLVFPVLWHGQPLFATARPVQVRTLTVAGTRIHAVEIDLSDPSVDLQVLLANQAPAANNSERSYGDEAFAQLVKRARAAAVINGTFFSKDNQKRVMGNLISAGKFLKYSRWENFGTSFGLTAQRHPEMQTLRAGDRIDWQRWWFSITCGPRLLRQGKIWLQPELEGFRDPHVFGAANRSALGFSANGKTLWLVSFPGGVTLEREARVMQTLGAAEAMNLDGGASQALAGAGRVLINAGRPLTNVIAVYDSRFPAPEALRQARQQFSRAETQQETDAPTVQAQSPVPTVTSFTAMTTAPVSLPDSQQALKQAKRFFWQLYRRQYAPLWNMLSQHSQQFLLARSEFVPAFTRLPESTRRHWLEIQQDPFYTAFWEQLRTRLNAEEQIKQNFNVVAQKEAVVLIQAEPAGTLLQLIREGQAWRLEVFESLLTP